MKKSPQVAIIMGSDSDLEIMSEAGKVFDDFDLPYEITV
ncbi:MAG: AIR carboxylase family protein, partial [Candidatus Paceibacterota bacterium]